MWFGRLAAVPSACAPAAHFRQCVTRYPAQRTSPAPLSEELLGKATSPIVVKRLFPNCPDDLIVKRPSSELLSTEELKLLIFEVHVLA